MLGIESLFPSWKHFYDGFMSIINRHAPVEKSVLKVGIIPGFLKLYLFLFESGMLFGQKLDNPT